MGNVNSLKGILLFAVRNGYAEVRVSKGLLPLMVGTNGETAYINGIAPVSGSLIANIKRDYMSNNHSLILTVSEQEFLAMSIGDDLIFRHLPLLTHDDNIGTKLASAIYSKTGMIILTGSTRQLRFMKAYKLASYIAQNRSITMAVVERNKFYTIKPAISKIINIHRPELELNSLIRISTTIEYDCIMVPDLNEDLAIKTLEGISQEKLVIASTTWEDANKIDMARVIYADHLQSEQIRKDTKANVRINKGVLHA